MDTPVLYYLVLAVVAIGGMALVLSVTIGIRHLLINAKIKSAFARKIAINLYYV